MVYRIFQKWMQQLFGEEEALLLLILLIAGLTLIVTMGSVLAPVIAAIIAAFLLQGMHNRLGVMGCPPWLSLWLTFIFFVGIIFLSFLFLLPLVWGQLVNLYNEVPSMIAALEHQLVQFQQDYPKILSEAQLAEWMAGFGQEITRFSQKAISASILNLPSIFGLMLYVVLVPLMVFFLLKDKVMIGTWLGGFLPKERPLLNRIGREMDEQVANYARGKAIEIIVVGAVSYVTFTVFGLNYAALLALLVGLSVIIPYIGAAAVTIPIAMVGYFQWGMTAEYAGLMVSYFVIQVLDGNLLVPLLFSEAVNLHPLAIIVAVVVFGGVWGFWGVFFAIPLATLVKALIDAWPKNAVPEIPDTETSQGGADS